MENSNIPRKKYALRLGAVVFIFALFLTLCHALQIGSDGIHFFNGTIDEVRIYNDSLGPDQAVIDYNAGIAGHVPNILSFRSLSAGDTFICEVTPSDSEALGPTLNSSGTLITSVPTVNTIYILPVQANDSSNLACYANPTDVENSTLTVEWYWYNLTGSGYVEKFHGNTTGLPKDTESLITTLDAGNTTEGDTWNCTVRAFDGTYYSDYYSATKTITSNTPPTIITPTISPSNPGTNSDLNCYTTSTDAENTSLVVEWYWYKDDVINMSGNTSVQNNTNTLIATVGAGNTTDGENWNCTVRAFDGSLYSNFTSANVTITNHLPSVVNLSYPAANDSTFTNRTPRYNWTAASDADGDTLTYHIEVSLTEDFTDSTVNLTNVSDLFYIMPRELDFSTYWWRVRANDTAGYGPWSDAWNFTVVTSPSIRLLQDSINFGSMQIGTVNDTSDDIPLPFKIENDGNIEVNISVNATALWQSSRAPLNSSYYQFKTNKSDEANSFDFANSITSWYNISAVPIKFVARLNHTDVSDVVGVDIRITVPMDEPAVEKTSGVLFIAEETT